MTKSIRYTLDDFIEIEEDGFVYNLPEETLELINKLSDMVGAPSYNKTPIFLKKEKRVNKKRGNMKIDMTDEDWEIFRNFQATELEKKEGIEKKLDECRMLLNKISNDNYNKIKDKLILIISELIDNEEYMTIICNFIFETASTNKFYSELYAKLYSELILKYEILNKIFNVSFSEFIVLFDNIESCNSSENYDLFCKINKNNEKRRAMSSFIVNLMKKDIITSNMLMDIILKLSTKFNELLLLNNMQASIEEISENLYILLTDSISYLERNDKWLSIINNLKDISKYNIKEYQSLSHKTIFKIMDILDKIKA